MFGIDFSLGNLITSLIGDLALAIVGLIPDFLAGIVGTLFGAPILG